MPNTASGIPYPLATDPPNGASQMQSLASAVEGLIASQGSVSFGTASTASFTSTLSFTNALTCSVAIPTYWTGYRMLVWAKCSHASSVDNTLQIQIGGVTAPNSTVQTTGGADICMGFASGTATGAVVAALQISGADGGVSPFSFLQIVAVAIRFS